MFLICSGNNKSLIWSKISWNPSQGLRLERRAKVYLSFSKNTSSLIVWLFVIPYLWLQKLSYFTLLQDGCLWNICVVLRNLVPCVHVKKREKQPWGVLLLVTLQLYKNNSPPWMFFTFLNCTNSTKLRKAPHI